MKDIIIIVNVIKTFDFEVRLFQITPGIERVQALADISRSALCCHSNETRAPIANPPNTAELEGCTESRLK